MSDRKLDDLTRHNAEIATANIPALEQAAAAEKTTVIGYEHRPDGTRRALARIA